MIGGYGIESKKSNLSTKTAMFQMSLQIRRSKDNSKSMSSM